MKKIFEIAGLVSLVLFSFYYTNEIIKISNEKDPIMVSINKYAEENNFKCKEGYMTSEGVVLGINGLEVNPELSYSNMKGLGYNEKLMVFEESSCILTKENNKKNYIIRGNELKNSVSLLIKINSFNHIEEIVKISEAKQIKMGIIINGIIAEKHKDYLNILYNSGYDILYSGNSEEDLEMFLNIGRAFDKKFETFCIYKKNEILELCSKNDINSIKTKFIFNKNILTNIKKTLEKGNLIILEENRIVLEELGVTINFIKSKGIEIIKLSEHLK